MSRNRVTSSDVAARAGVSRTTVSFVLNNVLNNKVGAATRERVIRAAEDLGYVPDAAARSLVSGKTGSIGLVVSYSSHILIDAFVSQALHGLIQVCEETGHRLLVETADIGRRPYDYDQLVSARQIDGLVVLNPDPHDERLVDLMKTDFPLVLLGGHPNRKVASVSMDSGWGMEAVTTHLLDHGHRRIGFIHYREIKSMDEGGRFAGYRRALAQAGVTFDPAIVRSGNYSAESGFAAMMSLLGEDEPPTAVVNGNDTIAIGANSAIWQSGRRVPDDIAVVGFDDIPIARYITPALTSVQVPALAMARKCGEMVIDLIKGNDLDTRHVQLPIHLVVRDSCGVHTPGGSSITADSMFHE